MRALPALLVVTVAVAPIHAQTTGDAPAGWRPEAIVDLRTPEGARLVRGEWRYRDAQIVQVDFRAPGPDLKPSGAPNRTYDISPHAGGADFDDSGWPVIDPAALEARRSPGRLSFGWYRLKVTIPERVGTLDPTGSTAIFEIGVDDYAEIWLDGKLPLVLGQTGGQLIKGWNAPNRVVLARDVKPGQQFQLAVFAINGPLSDPPANYIWIRSATLSLYKPDQAGGVQPVADDIVRLDPALGSGLGVSPQERIHRRRHRRVRSAGIERAHRRPRRTADDRGTRQPARHAAREERRADRAGRPV